MYFAIGNHDARNVGYTLFDKYFGSTHFTHVNGDVACAGFDSTIPDINEGRIGKHDIKRMREFLDENSQRFKIVVFHHHLLPVPHSGRERGLLTDAGNVLKVILDYKADLVLCGHRHSCNDYKIEDTIVVNSSTFSSFKTRAGDGNSFLYMQKKGSNFTMKRIDIASGQTQEHSQHCTCSCFVPAALREHRIVQISDTHFGGSEFSRKVYELACKKITSFSPDVVVHAGDITSDGLASSYVAAEAGLGKIGAPLFVVPGARDGYHVGGELYYEYFSSENKKIGRLNLIWADSVKFDESEGYIGRRQLKEITGSIVPGMINVVVFHHHIVPVPYTRERDVLEDAGDVLKTLCGKVDIILNGSRHIAFSTTIDGTVIVNSNTLSSRHVNSRYGNTFNVIDVLENSSVVVKEVGAVSGVARVLGVYSPLPPCIID